MLLSTTFTRQEFIAGLIALLGVIMIAHPDAIFGHTNDTIGTTNDIDKVTHSQRLIAISVSILGIFGASGAYTTIRLIGNRAHALISVSYFALLGTIGSALALTTIPSITFIMPESAREWILLLLLGVLGFVLQFLLTAGLQLDRSSRATSMMYTQILFALAFDWGIWGVLPGLWSFGGGAVVVASTLWVALGKVGGGVEKERVREVVDEESALLAAQVED